MTRQKDLKRLIRARMRKTGEAYTAARAQIVLKGRRGGSAPSVGQYTEATGHAPPPPARPPSPKDFAALAGMSDAVIKARTGCTWERWVYALDRRGADKLPHREIAEIVRAKYKVPDWWSQAVTVGYERIKGLRVRGQRRDGSYEASKSRTFDVPATTLFRAFADNRKRRRWLDDPRVRVRTSNPPKRLRLDGPETGIVAVEFTARGPAKCSVAVAHTKLPDRETADRMKAYWADRLQALGAIVR